MDRLVTIRAKNDAVMIAIRPAVCRGDDVVAD